MKDIIIIRDLNFKYNEENIFTNFSLNIKRNEMTTIIGENGSGKSTLVKIICGLFKIDGVVVVDDLVLNNENIKNIRKKIGVVFSNPDNQFVAETVMDDIAFTLENMGYDKNKIRKKVEEMAVLLEIKLLLEKNPHSLSGGEKQIVALASALIHQPKILILDEALTMIDTFKRDKIYKMLKEIKDLTIINICHDMEQTIYGDNIVVIKNGKVIIDDKKEKVYENEKLMEKLDLGIPFIIDLCNKLKFYNLIDKTYYNMEELADDLWK